MELICAKQGKLGQETSEVGFNYQFRTIQSGGMSNVIVILVAKKINVG